VLRQIGQALHGRPTLEGAGVRLHRASGYNEVPMFDQFLMLDDFGSDDPDDYLAGFPWYPHRGNRAATRKQRPAIPARAEHRGVSIGRSSPVAVFLMAAALVGAAYAHLPYMVEDTSVTVVEQPEVSKAYYGELSGRAALYEIVSSDSFELYVNILVPDEPGIPTDLTVTVARGRDTVFVLDGPARSWTRFYERFGGDSYLMGPEQRLRVGPGTYVATISRPGNEGRYAFAVGEREEFTFKQVIRIVGLMPRLKRDFFHKASIRAFTDPLGSLFRREE